MSSQLNESVEVARNYLNYLNQTSAAREYNIIQMCSSVISQPQKQISTAKPAKNIKKLILGKLKRFRRRLAMIDSKPHKSTNSPALQKFSYLTDISRIATMTTTHLNSSCGSEQHSASNMIVQEEESDDMFPDSNMFLFNHSDEISHLFEVPSQPESSSDDTSILMQGPNFMVVSEEASYIVPESASTPIVHRRGVSCQESVAYDMTLDDSTQVIDAPVLIESTFDTSSCSNLSSDLIILQTGYLNTCNSVSGSVQKQRQEQEMLCHGVPEWAKGFKLNLAVVNQVYFEQNGTRLFQ